MNNTKVNTRVCSYCPLNEQVIGKKSCKITPLYHSDGSFKLYNEYFDESGRIKEEITGG